MVPLVLTTCGFLLFNYNILSIWFSFFLNLSCYLSPFFWENQFFFFYESFYFIISKIITTHYFYCEAITDFNKEDYFLLSYYKNKNLNVQDGEVFYKYYILERTFNISFFLHGGDFHNIHNSFDTFYLLLLEATTSRVNLVDFYCLQDRQIILAGETSLSFYRIYNKFSDDILFYSVYIINPSILSLYLVKVQCFCFEEILINPGELINLPVLVYLDNTILLDNQMNWVRIIYLEYIALIKEVTYL